VSHAGSGAMRWRSHVSLSTCVESHTNLSPCGPSQRFEAIWSRDHLQGNSLGLLLVATAFSGAPAQAKQNGILIVGDDCSGEGCSMQTPNLDYLANEGMASFRFYARPSGPNPALESANSVFERVGGLVLTFLHA
jgi:hypothetical protein